MILVIDNFDSFTYNLVHYLEELGAETIVRRNNELTAEEALAMDVRGIVLSPGPCSPNEAGVCLDLLAKAPDDMPVFGVCLGHQAIGQAFGGVVGGAKEILHGKHSDITHAGGDMFAGVPETFRAVRYHSLAVARNSLPNVLKVEAETPDGEIMAVSHVARPVFGVQFHPESIGSEHGKTILANFLRLVGEIP